MNSGATILCPPCITRHIPLGQLCNYASGFGWSGDCSVWLTPGTQLLNSLMLTCNRMFSTRRDIFWAERLVFTLIISRGSGLILVCPCIRIRPSWADKTSVLPLFQ